MEQLDQLRLQKWSLKIKFWSFLTWLVQLSSTQIKNLFDYTIFTSKRLHCVRCAKLCSTSVVILADIFYCTITTGTTGGFFKLSLWISSLNTERVEQIVLDTRFFNSLLYFSYMETRTNFIMCKRKLGTKSLLTWVKIFNIWHSLFTFFFWWHWSCAYKITN